MPRIDGRHWQVAAGDDWKKIADAIGVTRDQLWHANGLSGYRPLVVGEVLHVPFGEP